MQPYWTILLAGNYGWQDVEVDPLTATRYKTTTYGVTLDGGFGAEYFSPWSLSAAVETSVLNLSYSHQRTTSNWLSHPISTSYVLAARASVSPRLFVRVHF